MVAPFLLINFIQIDAKAENIDAAMHTCAIQTDKKLRCWGFDSRQMPEDTPEELGSVIGVAAGVSHTCAIRESGDLRCWGKNHSSHNQLIVPQDLGKVISVAAGGGYHICAIRAEDSALRCWGDNSHGQSLVPSDLGKVISVAVGNYSTCAIKEDGDLRCWGIESSRSNDVKFPQEMGKVIAVAMEGGHTCAIKKEGGKLWCWGSNDVKQSVVPSDLGIVTAVSTGWEHTCAIKKEDRQLQCWGGTKSDQINLPKNLGPVTAVALGFQHTCAITLAGKVKCWGDNTKGQTNVPSDLNMVRSSAELATVGRLVEASRGVDLDTVLQPQWSMLLHQQGSESVDGPSNTSSLVHDGEGNPELRHFLLGQQVSPATTTNRTWTAALCFPGETLVSVKNDNDNGYHSVPISWVQVGDTVMSCNLSVEGGVCDYGQVQNVISQKTGHLIQLSFSGKTLRTTDHHPFYVVGKKDWVEAKDLHIGDQFQTIAGEIATLEYIQDENGDYIVYNLDVQGHHNYYACDVLVHNCTIGATAAITAGALAGAYRWLNF